VSVTTDERSTADADAVTGGAARPPVTSTSRRRARRGARILAVIAGLVLSLTAPALVAAEEPTYSFTVSTLDDATKKAMTGPVWRKGCPIRLEDLRAIDLTYWGFDGQVHSGRLVVHVFWAPSIGKAFGELFAAKFPIERMEPIEAYGGSDDRSVIANNTSAFNCRNVAGTKRWSRHAYGLAIDINPKQNPFVAANGTVMDPAARRYIDRSLNEPGMIKKGDVVVRAFTEMGWIWGGNWKRSKDYQHVSDR
jgi:hypothetical protein